MSSTDKIHFLYIGGLAVISLISIYVLAVIPHGAPVPQLQSSFFLFGLAMNTCVLLWSIGIYLLHRWFKTGKKNPALLVWSLSFFIFSITFIAHLFRAFGIAAANENLSPAHFLLYRWGMAVFAGGMFYGILNILTDKKWLQITASVGISGVGLLWLILGLFVIPSENPIEFTMYLFLHTIWIPVCLTMSYVFFYYGHKSKKSGPKIISLGFLLLMISYFGWAPWHFAEVVYIYFIWYSFFIISLTPILLGFVVMTLEEQTPQT